ncbi:beta-propeller fold lactonase family protein [Psychromarinibacter sp. C21-152]|uniref:Beta-propeller fold lactonase family protein n=1 Tax=Psychromarinibacter sediminicola TaxID=3033385 RepID=A0AAE3NQX1_9RHOB|nr:beta-propeller fold lactonase family protein [Psychromarinibacter sediminicola]MDF0600447.1 beta-propeller fold lactonase family protein [Psychromarinibacter sediminicola]
MAGRDVVYASLGPLLRVFGLDTGTGALTRRQELHCDEVVQHGWANRARSRLYVVTSGSGPMTAPKRPDHFVRAYAIGTDGRLTPLQEPVRLRNRPLFATLDAGEAFLLIAYNAPSDVTVHRLDAAGAVAEEVPQDPLYFGTTVHQVRVSPRGDVAFVPACAHDPAGIPAGCLDLFGYAAGRLSPRGRIGADPARAPAWRGVRNGAQGFAARHVAFHPTRPWMYLVLEAQNEVQLYDIAGGLPGPRPRHVAGTLAEAPTGRSRQLASAVHVHPGGRFLYVTNRAWETEPDGDRAVFVGGANTVAAFALDPETGEPRPIQQVDTGGIFPRTFGMDAAGRALVVGNQEPFWIRSDGAVRRVPPGLAVFGIGGDGRLSLLNRHAFEADGGVCFWTTTLTLDAAPAPDFSP